MQLLLWKARASPPQIPPALQRARCDMELFSPVQGAVDLWKMRGLTRRDGMAIVSNSMTLRSISPVCCSCCRSLHVGA